MMAFTSKIDTYCPKVDAPSISLKWVLFPSTNSTPAAVSTTFATGMGFGLSYVYSF